MVLSYTLLYSPISLILLRHNLHSAKYMDLKFPDWCILTTAYTQVSQDIEHFHHPVHPFLSSIHYVTTALLSAKISLCSIVPGFFCLECFWVLPCCFTYQQSTLILLLNSILLFGFTTIHPLDCFQFLVTMNSQYKSFCELFFFFHSPSW